MLDIKFYTIAALLLLSVSAIPIAQIDAAETEVGRADTAWLREIEVGRADTAWLREVEVSRADTAWLREVEVSRADTAWL
ncbi:hypothetical protein CVT25_009642 [Psilocybe cyanescens]|uniref:Uncharacterized protein n=1 Tax=Psilocybe cyanescens TaxID=93625 RepID=A0A409XGX4_PSICY|nr:hypothetical protein CVT25_009642 [Psilocybe cyanescens]